MKSTHTVAYRQLLTLLISARKQSGITQQELAARLGRPQSFVSKVELGERRLDVIEFLQVCGAIDTDPHALLERLREEAARGR